MNDMWTMFASQDRSGTIVNLVILGLFALGVLDVLRSWARLVSDERQVRRAKAALAGSGLSDASGEGVLEALQIPPKSLLGGRVSRILQLRSSGLGYRDVLQKLTLERIEGYGAHARYIASILTLLGLVGTVIGMSLAMVKISGAFKSVNNIQALNELTLALSGTLEGMKTAFACTLVGLAAAVVLSGFNHGLRRRQSRVVRALEEFVICELLPALETVDPEADSAAKAFATAFTKASRKLAGVSDVLTTVSSRYDSSSSEMTQTARALTSAVEQLATSTSALSKYQETLEGRLHALEKNVQDSQALQNSIVSYNAQFKGLISETTRNMESSLKQLLSDVNQHYRDGIKGHVDESQRRLAQVINENSTQFSSVLKDNSTHFSTVLEKHSSQLKDFSDMMLAVYVNGRKTQSSENQS